MDDDWHIVTDIKNDPCWDCPSAHIGHSHPGCMDDMPVIKCACPLKIDGKCTCEFAYYPDTPTAQMVTISFTTSAHEVENQCKMFVKLIKDNGGKEVTTRIVPIDIGTCIYKDNPRISVCHRCPRMYCPGDGNYACSISRKQVSTGEEE